MIHFLSPEDAQKIAAGEVIERPANIIKELVENSIDAHATEIKIAVKHAGKTHISIIDNGLGMSLSDARLCIKRHTTSKLRTFDDLNSISSFGFRGEALASICSVARVLLTTREKDALEGANLAIEQGNIISEKIVSAQKGTTFCVDDLFYTVPVRKKFLKSTATEWNQILALFKSFCFSYPTVHFTLIHDDSQIFNCPPVTSLKARCEQLFEKKISETIMELHEYKEKNIIISGCITNQQYSRYDRSGFYFFVNNRLIKDYKLARAVLHGYENTLSSQQYPVAIISITIDPQEVDVNIHPKKEEVLFLHPHKVEQAITQAVKQTLTKQAANTLQATHITTNVPSFHYSKPFERKTPDPFFEQPFTSQPTNFYLPEPFIPSELTKQESIVEDKKEPSIYNIIGQYADTYILIEHPEGLLFIDQHAAHERILYEQFKNYFDKTETVTLLFPPIVTLTKDDVALLCNYTDLLESQGIMIEIFGEEQLRVTAVPVYAKQIHFSELLQDVVCWIAETQTEPQDVIFKKITEKLHAQLACKAAVKAGDLLTIEKMQELVRNLEKVENRHSCPHGRPTQWLLNTHEIEKKFKRIT